MHGFGDYSVAVPGSFVIHRLHPQPVSPCPNVLLHSDFAVLTNGDVGFDVVSSHLKQ